MKWPLIYTFLAATITVLGFIEREPVYLITAFFIYLIALIWLKRIVNLQSQPLELEEKKDP
ncbi:hypothetical protein ES703_04079 [subsurface metagenome]